MAGKRIAVFSLLALVALALAVFASSGTEAGTYKSHLQYTLSDYTAGANGDNQNTIAIPNPDYNYEDASMFTLNPVSNSAASGDRVPIGAGVGLLDAVTSIGIANGPCSTPLSPSFKLYNASVKTWDVIPAGTPPHSPGDYSMYWVLKDKLAYPIPDQDVDGLPDYLEHYPHFLNDFLDPDGPCDPTVTGLPTVCDLTDPGSKRPLQPRARYAGHDFVANMNILIQVLVFAPGQLDQMPATRIMNQFGAGIGAVSIVMLNNPVNQEESPGAISDFCTPLNTTTTTYGITTDNPNTAADESGHVISTNPAASTGILDSGTHIARNYSRSERDADGDGIENDLDPCPYTVDADGPGGIVDWDPRSATLIQPGADNDGDGLPNSCDPAPGTLKTDEDDDGYLNKQDICPLVKNGCTAPSAVCPISNPAWDNQADNDSQEPNADLGPQADSIGDSCDDSDDDGQEAAAGCGAVPGTGDCNDGIDNDADTLIDGNDPECTPCMDKADSNVNGNWGTNPGNGIWHHAMPWSAVCVPDTDDADDDGYCDALETTLGSPSNDGPETGADCAPGDIVDDDGDTYVNDGCPLVGQFGESGAECLNAVSDDTAVADSCPIPYPPAYDGPDCDESAITADAGAVNDGCPAIGVPESLVIDAAITVGSALPSNAVPQSCSDGVDNDGDTLIDGADIGALACDPADASYATDPDHDGHNPDNCPSSWNPEQVNTDAVLAAGGGTLGPNPLASDTNGDVCDTDDDNDGFTDLQEASLGTDPLHHCPLSTTSPPGKQDAWPLDMDQGRLINLGTDVSKYIGKMGCTVSENWSCRRLDMDGGGLINLGTDVSKYIGKMGWTCTTGTAP